MGLDPLWTFAPVDWVLSQLSESPSGIALWSLLCFFVGYRVSSSLRYGVMRRAFVLQRLNERERFCLRKVAEIEGLGRTASVSSESVYSMPLSSLVSMGVLESHRGTKAGGAVTLEFTVSPPWRRWVARHMGELPASDPGA